MSELVAALSADEARALTDRIRLGFIDLEGLITEAFTRRAWTALGYNSWNAYYAAEFTDALPRLSTGNRRQLVGTLHDAGMSTRAIAATTGASRNTVKDDLRQVVQIDPPASTPTPAPDDEDVVDAEIIEPELGIHETIQRRLGQHHRQGRPPLGSHPIASIAAGACPEGHRRGRQVVPRGGSQGPTEAPPASPRPAPTSWLGAPQGGRAGRAAHQGRPLPPSQGRNCGSPPCTPAPRGRRHRRPPRRHRPPTPESDRGPGAARRGGRGDVSDETRHDAAFQLVLAYRHAQGRHPDPYRQGVLEGACKALGAFLGCDASPSCATSST